MNEFELIHRLIPTLPTNPSVRVGAGDDCAVLDLGLPEAWLLFKTDSVVEGIHFTTDTLPEKIGRKALGRCLSDIAAMAGTPNSALITIGLPREFEVSRIEGIYRGINELAGHFGVAVAGGETTTNPERVWISVAMVGTVAKNKCALRSGAKPGDAVFVTGELGGSLAGKHLDFEPRLVEARWLADHVALHAMMDISDGLAGDLRHLLHASQAGAELLADAIPISPAARRMAQDGRSHKTPLAAALTDGEDFELLFTVASRDAVPLVDAWKQQFTEPALHCIGKVLAEPTVSLRTRDGVRSLADQGYVHFH